MPSDVLVRHNVNVSGKGTQPLLFSHGLACDQNVWHLIKPAFDDDYRIILFDFVGSGQSDLKSYNKEKYSSLEGYAEDVLNICEELQLQDVIFVGHSVSSIIGLLAAIKNPFIFSKLIMLGPSPRYINEPGYIGGFERAEIDELLAIMKENYTKWAAFFAPKAMANPEIPELSEQLKDGFCTADPAITYEFARVTFLSDNRKDLPLLKTPILILQIAEDIVAPLQVGEYMHKNIAASTLYYMKATGHFPHLSAPQETIELIKKYLKTK